MTGSPRPIEPPRPGARLGAAFFERPAIELAPELIGCTFTLAGAGGRIVEVEAYDEAEPASHAYRGRTRRNAAMFGPPGHAYVYRSYGIHWCMNFVCESGRASAVLLRALEPSLGLPAMRGRRGLDDARLLCSGPGRLCQALGVGAAHDGKPIDAAPFELLESDERPDVTAGPRVGISKAVELPWRFCEAGSPYLSRHPG